MILLPLTFNFIYGPSSLRNVISFIINIFPMESFELAHLVYCRGSSADIYEAPVACVALATKVLGAILIPGNIQPVCHPGTRFGAV